MSLDYFKKRYPVLFWRWKELSKEELLESIIQLENKRALKDFIRYFWLEETKKNFLKIRQFFEANPNAKHRYQMMYNWFIFYKKKLLWLIDDMRKYRFWRTRKI